MTTNCRLTSCRPPWNCCSTRSMPRGRASTRRRRPPPSRPAVCIEAAYSVLLFPAAMSAASDGRSACKPWCASTVCPRRRYSRANGMWTKGDQKVKLWCLCPVARSPVRWPRPLTSQPGHRADSARPPPIAAGLLVLRNSRAAAGRPALARPVSRGPARLRLPATARRQEPSFSYMTSSGRLPVPLLFKFCSPVMNINGRGGQAVTLPSALR